MKPHRMYLHRTKDQNLDTHNELDLPESTWDNFKWTLAEVTADCDINEKNGDAEVIRFFYNGKEYLPSGVVKIINEAR